MRNANYNFIVKLIKETYLDSIAARELVEYIVVMGDINNAIFIYESGGIAELMMYKRGLKCT